MSTIKYYDLKTKIEQTVSENLLNEFEQNVKSIIEPKTVQLNQIKYTTTKISPRN